jgi:hypothetical protein
VNKFELILNRKERQHVHVLGRMDRWMDELQHTTTRPVLKLKKKNTDQPPLTLTFAETLTRFGRDQGRGLAGCIQEGW